MSRIQGAKGRGLPQKALAHGHVGRPNTCRAADQTHGLNMDVGQNGRPRGPQMLV